MSATEVKRRGRPPRVQETAPEGYAEAAESTDATPKEGPRCHNCFRPLEKSTALLRAFGMTAYRCTHCCHVAVEGDDYWYDFKTAVSGDPPMIVERASILYSIRNQGNHIEPSKGPLDDAMDDDRWAIAVYEAD